MNEYLLKFKDGGVWMDTAHFIELVTELQQRFGIDAKVAASMDGLVFSIDERNDA